jgi:glutathionylspermidine synthase
VRNEQAIILNPAYTMLFQSKGILKYLWDLFPNEPLLLECSFTEPIGRSDYRFVQKVFFGREGANVTIYDEIGLPEEIRDGEYGTQPSVYQAYADLAQDAEGQYYQSGIFFAYEACGLGFRRSPKKIIDNGAQFVGHVVEY